MTGTQEGETTMAMNKITNEEGTLAAVRQGGSALQDVPENLKTAKICLEAVKHNSWALEFVPKPLRDKVLRALKSGD